MGVGPVAGRLLEQADRVTGEAVIVNATAAQQYFGGQAVGHTLRTKGRAPRQWRIVGVVPAIRHGGPQGRVGPEMYVLPDPHEAAESTTTLAMIMRLREGASLSIEQLN